MINFKVLLIILFIIIILAFVFMGSFSPSKNVSQVDGSSPGWDGGGGEYEGFIGGADRPFRLAMRGGNMFENVKNGKITEAIRLHSGVFNKDAQQPIKVGDIISISRSRPPGETTQYVGDRNLKAKITHITHYKTLDDLFKKEDYKKSYPYTKDLAQAVSEIRIFISKEQEEEHGLVLLKFSLLKTNTPTPATKAHHRLHHSSQY